MQSNFVKQNLFKPSCHNITVVGEWIKKELEDPEILSKEYNILKYLKEKGYKNVPSVEQLNLCERYYLEERIPNKLSTIDHRRIITLIQDYQNIPLTQELKNNLQDKLFSNGSYSHTKILDVMTCPSDCKVLLQAIGKIKEYCVSADLYLKNIGIKKVLTHVDVAAYNIMVDEGGEFYFIDWADCRLDLKYVDIAHYLYTEHFDHNIVLSLLPTNDTEEQRMYVLHMILCNIYDLINSIKSSSALKEYLNNLINLYESI
jgi:hypothetical protein